MLQIASAVVAGISTGMVYFLAAAGLTMMFGVMGVLNFAVGALVMVGAFLQYSILNGQSSSALEYVGALAIAGLACALLSALSEKFGFRRLYSQGRDSLTGMLLSFGLLILVTGIVPLIWGTSGLLQSLPPSWNGSVTFGGVSVTRYKLVVLIGGIILVGIVFLFLRFSRIGLEMIAVSYDRDVCASMGIAPNRVSMWAFAIGGFLAGAAGALIAPNGAIDPTLGENYLLFAFVAVALGGLGSFPGALVGAIIIGLLDSFLSVYLPSLEPFSLYIAAGAVLIFRPNGLAPISRFISER